MWRNLFQNRRAAIKEGGDNLPMGLCFAAQSGNVLFLNRMMESLSYRLIGESLQNATYFWDRIADGNLQNGIVCEKRPELTKENQYLIRFANGECRTFTRSILELDGEEIVEITSQIRRICMDFCVSRNEKISHYFRLENAFRNIKSRL